MSLLFHMCAHSCRCTKFIAHHLDDHCTRSLIGELLYFSYKFFNSRIIIVLNHKIFASNSYMN